MQTTVTNKDRFQAELTAAYRDLFANDPEYAYSAARTTPEALAAKMTDGLITGSANKDGEGIKRACKAVGIAHTYKGDYTMSYRREREEFIARMTKEGLSMQAIQSLLKQATTINRLAELACSSEAADRDRIACPADTFNLRSRPQKPYGPCLCDGQNGAHVSIPRIRLQDHQAEMRAMRAVPAGWRVLTSGDPRGYTLRVIPPSYAERNEGRDYFNLDSIGVPAGPSGLRW